MPASQCGGGLAPTTVLALSLTIPNRIHFTGCDKDVRCFGLVFSDGVAVQVVSNTPFSTLAAGNMYVRLVRTNSPVVHDALLASQQLRYQSTLDDLAASRSQNLLVRPTRVFTCLARFSMFSRVALPPRR